MNFEIRKCGKLRQKRIRNSPAAQFPPITKEEAKRRLGELEKKCKIRTRFLDLEEQIPKAVSGTGDLDENAQRLANKPPFKRLGLNSDNIIDFLRNPNFGEHVKLMKVLNDILEPLRQADDNPISNDDQGEIMGHLVFGNELAPGRREALDAGLKKADGEKSRISIEALGGDLRPFLAKLHLNSLFDLFDNDDDLKVPGSEPLTAEEKRDLVQHIAFEQALPQEEIDALNDHLAQIGGWKQFGPFTAGNNFTIDRLRDLTYQHITEKTTPPSIVTQDRQEKYFKDRYKRYSKQAFSQHLGEIFGPQNFEGSCGAYSDINIYLHSLSGRLLLSRIDINENKVFYTHNGQKIEIQDPRKCEILCRLKHMRECIDHGRSVPADECKTFIDILRKENYPTGLHRSGEKHWHTASFAEIFCQSLRALQEQIPSAEPVDLIGYYAFPDTKMTDDPFYKAARRARSDEEAGKASPNAAAQTSDEKASKTNYGPAQGFTEVKEPPGIPGITMLCSTSSKFKPDPKMTALPPEEAENYIQAINFDITTGGSEGRSGHSFCVTAEKGEDGKYRWIARNDRLQKEISRQDVEFYLQYSVYWSTFSISREKFLELQD